MKHFDIESAWLSKFPVKNIYANLKWSSANSISLEKSKICCLWRVNMGIKIISQLDRGLYLIFIPLKRFLSKSVYTLKYWSCNYIYSVKTTSKGMDIEPTWFSSRMMCTSFIENSLSGIDLKYYFSYIFMPLYWKIRGHIVLPLSVCLSICPSVCTNLMWKLNIFQLLLNLFTYKAHIWYEGVSHQYASAGTKVKVICKGQGQI